jgi:ABC-type transporter Mla subunit MlaD
LIEFVPKLRTISDNVEHISTVTRAKVNEVGATVTQVNQTVQQVNQTVQNANGRARAQVARADTMVTDALTATQDLSQKVQHTIRVPVRQIAGLVAGFKAGLETLIERSPFAVMRNNAPRESSPYGSVPRSQVPRDPGRPYDV